MRTALVMLSVLALAGCGAGGEENASPAGGPAMAAEQRPPPPLRGGTDLPGDPDVVAVSALERRLWEAWRKRDRATIESLSDPAYVAVSEESVVALPGVLAGFDRVHLDGYALGPFAAVRAGPDAIVLNYRARLNGRYDGPDGSSADLSRAVSESSLWVRRGGRWRNLMTHETTVAPIPFPNAPDFAVPAG